MIRKRSREERSSLGIVLRPVAEIILEKDNSAVEINFGWSLMREMDELILRNDGGTAYNRAYLASVLCTYAQISLRGTSDTLVTLSEMLCLRKTKRMGEKISKLERCLT